MGTQPVDVVLIGGARRTRCVFSTSFSASGACLIPMPVRDERVKPSRMSSLKPVKTNWLNRLRVGELLLTALREAATAVGPL